MTDRIDQGPPAGDDLTESLTAIGRWADPIAVPGTRDLDARTIRYEEQPRSPGLQWQRITLVAAAVVLVVAGVWVFSRNDRQSPLQPTPTVSDSTVPGVVGDGQWVETSASPLEPRNRAQAVWNGTEVIVFGGTTQPECPVCDFAGYGPTLHDAAAYDPATDTWRSIAPLPDDASYLGVAARVGKNLFWMSVKDPSTNASGWDGTIYQYHSDLDSWEQMPLPGDIPLPPMMTSWGNRLVLYSSASAAGTFPMEVLDPETETWTATDLPFPTSEQHQILEIGGDLYLFAFTPSAAGTQVAQFAAATSTWTELASRPGYALPVAVVDGLAVAPYTYEMGPSGAAYDASTDTWGDLATGKNDNVAGVVGVDSAWFGGWSGKVARLDLGAVQTLPALPSGLDQIAGASVTAASYDLFVFGGNVTFRTPGELTSRAFLWRSGSEEVSSTSVPETTTAPSALPELQPAGACGLVGFYAIDADATVSVEVYIQLGSFGDFTEPSTFESTYEVADGNAVVTLRRGKNLGEAICNDVISTLRVDSEAHATAGTLRMSVFPTPGKETTSTLPLGCGDWSGTLEATDLRFDDGTVIPRLSLGGQGVNCFAG